MKQNIKYALLALFSFLMMSCQKSQEYYEGVYIVGADKLSPVANLTIDDLPAVIGIKVASSNAMENNVEVMMKSTPELVESFNKEYKKNYELLPEKSYKLENTSLIIENGNFFRRCTFKYYQSRTIERGYDLCASGKYCGSV